MNLNTYSESRAARATTGPYGESESRAVRRAGARERSPPSSAASRAADRTTWAKVFHNAATTHSLPIPANFYVFEH